MEPVRIPGCTLRYNSLDAPTENVDMVLHWHETDPMVVLFSFAKPGYAARNFWRGGRELLSLAAVSGKHGGLSNIRIGPYDAATTMLHLITPKGRQAYFTIPTEPFKQYLLATYRKVTPGEEQKALEHYINNWLRKVVTQ